MKEELLEMTYDAPFKAFMTSENTRVFKAKLIHLITGLDEELLFNAEYQSIELPVKNKKDKKYRSDIIVKVRKNILSLEMNHEKSRGRIIKNKKYMHVIDGQTFESGEKYDDRFLYLLNFDNFDNFDTYHLGEIVYVSKLMEIKHHLIEDESYIHYHINLSKWTKTCYTNNELELMHMLKIFQVRNLKELDELRGEKYMDDAIDEIKRICQDEHIIGLYNAEKVAELEKNTDIFYAKEEAKEEKCSEIVRNMLKKDMDIELISEVTGLSKEQIEELK